MVSMIKAHAQPEEMQTCFVMQICIVLLLIEHNATLAMFKNKFGLKTF
jgi:hypothetical protein